MGPRGFYRYPTVLVRHGPDRVLRRRNLTPLERLLKKHLPSGNFANVSVSRSKAMSAVRGRGNKTTERRLRSALSGAGVSGWQMHSPDVFGKPDFYFPAAGLAVFVDGCFWHGCRRCSHALKTNASFWTAKINRNRDRDKRTNA